MYKFTLFPVYSDCKIMWLLLLLYLQQTRFTNILIKYLNMPATIAPKIQPWSAQVSISPSYG